ncbi:acetolactate synthase catalytic subunit, partial [Halobium palmae]
MDARLALGLCLLVAFAERAGAGVVEQSPAALCFPREHPLHAGFRPEPAVDRADLLLLVDTDVPWTPSDDTPFDPDVPVVHIDVDPEKRDYPLWDFRVDD